jgi:glutamate-1-semialdehyde 2,1-aminomutase
VTAQRNVLLIFDEVITGFRLAAGGAQALHGVMPDLATFGKALAAGERLSAVAGKAEIMRVLEPGRADGGPSMFQSGTSNDGTVALAAARAALQVYGRLGALGAYAALARRGERLADGIRGAFRAREVPVHVNQLGSMLQLFVTSEPPGFERYSALDTRPLALFYLALINEGILLSLPTSNHIYLSFAHSDADVDATVDKVRAVLGSDELCTLLRATS